MKASFISSIKAQITSLWRKARGSLANHACTVCLMPGPDRVCPVCIQDLPTYDLTKWQGNLLNHPTLANHLSLPGVERLIAVGEYQWPYSHMISALKFHQKQYMGAALGELLAHQLNTHQIMLPPVIVPVPLHNTRFSERGYNQAVQIIRWLQRTCAFDIDYQLIARRKATKAQTSLGKRARNKNLKNAFTLRRNKVPEHLVLFDDVITTGATIRAIVALIKRYSPDTRIDVWCIAITPER